MASSAPTTTGHRREDNFASANASLMKEIEHELKRQHNLNNRLREIEMDYFRAQQLGMSTDSINLAYDKVDAKVKASEKLVKSLGKILDSLDSLQERKTQ